MKKGWQWPVIVVGLLASGVLANTVFMVVAVDDPSFAVERDYYAKAVAWDAHQAQARANGELGWSVSIEVSPAEIASGNAQVVARVLDHDGAPVAGASVTLEAFHNARAAQIVEAVLSETGEHAYAARLPIRRAGLWEFRVAVARGTQRFTAVTSRDAPGIVR